jgi:hypothetical protein
MGYSEKDVEESLKKILGDLGRHFQERGYTIDLKRIDSGILEFALMEGEKIVAAIQFMDLAGKLCLGIGGERAVEKLIKDQLLAMGYAISPEDKDMAAGALFNYPSKEEEKKHPDLREGEVFIGNVVSEDIADMKINWKTLRIGDVAYEDDEVIRGKHPMFVFREEWEIRKGLR